MIHDEAFDRAAIERGAEWVRTGRHPPLSAYENAANLRSGLSCACLVWSLRVKVKRP